MLPRNVQHSYPAGAPMPSSLEDTGTNSRPLHNTGEPVTRAARCSSTFILPAQFARCRIDAVDRGAQIAEERRGAEAVAGVADGDRAADVRIGLERPLHAAVARAERVHTP